jgi:large subunit ribosomal protein L4
MQLPVYNLSGQPTGAVVEIPEALLSFEPHEHLIWLDVKRILADRRQGTHKTKTRGEVQGSKRKLYRQKGTGHARMGSIRNPIRRHGGTVFGPVPRDYALKMNKKEKILARWSAFILHLKNNALWVVEDVQLEKPKTKTVASLLSALQWDGKPLQIYTNGYNPNFYLSARNIVKVSISPAEAWNTYDLTKASRLLWEKSALENLLGQIEL